MCKGEKAAAETGWDWSRTLAVTDRSQSPRPFEEQIRRICALRPLAVLLREKDLAPEAYCRLGRRVQKICGAYGVSCIFHSFLPEAAELGGDSIHLPLWKLREADRELLRGFKRIGCSVHSAEEALEARRLGATYLMAGHIYATDCKRGLPPRGIPFLRQVCALAEIPVYAIGGIRLNPEQMAEITAAGAAGACVMSAAMRI